MPARLPRRSKLVAPVGALLLLGACAAGSGGTPPAGTPAPRQPEAPPPARPPAAEFEPTAPGETVSHSGITARKLIVGDMLRLGVVEAVVQGPRGVLRTAVGRTFHTTNRKDQLYPQLALNYSAWASDTAPLVIELWERGEKIGEFRETVFLIDPEHTTPIACTEPGPAGICGYGPEGPPPAPAPPPAVAAGPEQPAPPAPAGERTGRGGAMPSRRGISIEVGVGGGAADLTCDRCDFSSQAGLSGFVSLGAGIADATVLAAEATGWTRETDPGFNAQVYSLMATLTRYVESGVSLTIGLGLVGYREDSDFGKLRANGFGYMGRLGYDLPIGGRFRLTPYLGYLGTLGGTEFKFDGSGIGKYGIGNLQFGLGVGIH